MSIGASPRKNIPSPSARYNATMTVDDVERYELFDIGVDLGVICDISIPKVEDELEFPPAVLVLAHALHTRLDDVQRKCHDTTCDSRDAFFYERETWPCTRPRPRNGVCMAS